METRFLKEDYEYIEIPREEYEKVQQAIRNIELPFLSINEFVEQQIKNLLEKYAEYVKQEGAYERGGRKRE